MRNINKVYINRRLFIYDLCIFKFFGFSFSIILLKYTKFLNNNFNQNLIPKKIPKKLIWRNHKINIKNIHNEILSYNKNVNISLMKENIKYIENPKISLIITLYNQESFILKIYSCISHQTLKDIEIIFIDDNSNDNSFLLIKKLMKIDKRIVYFKNRINRGQFYSRNKGALKSKGEYILILDPDDLLLNNILIKIYDTAKKYNLDIVQYYHMIGSFEKNVLIKFRFFGVLYQPQTKNIFFNSSDRYLWDKLIKRKTFIKSIKFMDKKYRNERFPIHNDETACFGIFKVANSYGFLEEIGYFWNRNNPNSTSRQNLKPENTNERFHSIFTTMQYYYEQSDNNNFEKVKGGYNFFKVRIISIFEKQIKYLSKGFDYIIKVINLYLNSKYFNKNQKNNLKRFLIKIYLQKRKINLKI